MATNHPTVEYRDISGYPGYRVGDDGSVWSCLVVRRIGEPRVISSNWKRLTPGIPRERRGDRRCYPYVNLHGGGRQVSRKVHTLVLETFVGPRPDGLECRHLDGDPLNNHLTNLQWGTTAENAEDRTRHGRLPRGEHHCRAKLTDTAIRDIRRRRAGGTPASVLAAEYNVGSSTIRRIARRAIWTHVV